MRAAPAKDVVLEGQGVRLEPIGAQHADDLFAALCREDDDALWTYLAWERPRDREQMAALVEQLATDDERVFVAIVPTETGRAAGFCGLMRIDPRWARSRWERSPSVASSSAAALPPSCRLS